MTGNKPLSAILGPKKGIPVLAASRLRRWAILLSAYNYKIEFRSTKQHINADALSRLPLNEYPSTKDDVDCIFNMSQIEALAPLTSDKIAAATRKDGLLSKVMQYTRNGWPDQELVQFRRRDEITIEGNCLMWVIMVIIPNKCQPQFLQQLHTEHPGITRMKPIARSYAWWPGMDQEIESVVKECGPCQQVRSEPPKAPLNPWPWPNKPWSRLHIDFAGPFLNKTYLFLVDAFSKWPEVIEMTSTTAVKTIEALRHVFATHGLPDCVVTDNGPQFIAEEFKSVLIGNGVRHFRAAPYHPATNGLVERFVQTLKRAILVGKKDGRKSGAFALANFLLKYRTTPHATG